MAIVTRKGQVTIPKHVRDALGLRPGSQVEFDLEDGRTILRRRIPPEVFEKWRGYLRGKLPDGLSVDELIDEMRGERLPADWQP